VDGVAKRPMDDGKSDSQLRAETTRLRHGSDFFSRIGSKGAEARRRKRDHDPEYLAKVAAVERQKENHVRRRHLRSYVHVLEDELRSRQQRLIGLSSPIGESELDYLAQLRHELERARAQLHELAVDVPAT